MLTVVSPKGAMDSVECCVAPSGIPRSEDQIVPAHLGDCWSPVQSNSQTFVDAWLLQMQVSVFNSIFSLDPSKIRRILYRGVPRTTKSNYKRFDSMDL